MKRTTVTRVLHDGWEMDNQAWVEEDGKGNMVAMTTNHGAKCVVEKDWLDEKINETAASLAGLKKIKYIMWGQR